MKRSITFNHEEIAIAITKYYEEDIFEALKLKIIPGGTPTIVSLEVNNGMFTATVRVK